MNDPAQAYDRIVRPIEDRMIQSIWRIVRNAQDAEDVMQDVLVTILRRWDRIVRHAKPQALVLKICIDAACDRTRRVMRERRRLASQEMLGECSSMSPLPSDELGSKEQYLEILAAIHRLPRKQATATLMRLVQKLSYEEIAATLGCSEATARKHVARSRERLRTWLAHLNPNLPEGAHHEPT